MTTTESTLAKHCGECGKPLAEPGGQCAACGAYPDVSCMNRDALRSLLSDEGALASLLRGALAGTAIGMRAEAGMKHQEASQLLAEADRLEHGEAAQAAVTAAVELADAGGAKVDALEAAVGPAISAARGAEDRARKAAEHARVTAAEEAEASESGSGEPEELSALIVRRDAAAVVAARERAAAEGATAARQRAESDLAQAREQAAARRRDLAAAQAFADDPDPVVTKSDWTLSGDWPALLRKGKLTAAELARVRSTVADYAEAAGAGDLIRGRLRRQDERAARQRASLAPVPRVGQRRSPVPGFTGPGSSVYVPGVPGAAR